MAPKTGQTKQQMDIVDSMALPEGKDDPLIKLYSEIEKNIDVFSDVEPSVIMPMNNVFGYAKKLREFRILGSKGPDPAVMVADWLNQYLRLRASKSRKSRAEVQEIMTAEKMRTMQRISIDGGTQGTQGATLR